MLVCVEKLPKSEEWCIFIKPESTECVVTSQQSMVSWAYMY